MTPEDSLQQFIDRFAPKIAELAAAAVFRLRELLPNAVVLVYDNYNALAIGFGPSESAREGIFSLAVYASKVNLNFLQGGVSSLRDPDGLLQGSGSLNRFVTLVGVETLDDPAVTDLMRQAIDAASKPLDPTAKGYVVVKSISAKQRPRRS